MTALGEKIDVVLVEDATVVDRLILMGRGRFQILHVQSGIRDLGFFNDISGEDIALRALGQLLGSVKSRPPMQIRLGKKDYFLMRSKKLLSKTGYFKGNPNLQLVKILAKNVRSFRLKKELVEERIRFNLRSQRKKQARKEEEPKKERLLKIEEQLPKIQERLREEKEKLHR